MEAPAPEAPPRKGASVVLIASAMLKEALASVNRAVASNTTLPILKNVLVQPGEGELVFTATDLELGLQMRRSIGCQPGPALALQGKTLGEIVGALAKGDVSLTLDYDLNRAIVRSGKSEYHINALDAEEFPSLAIVDGGAIVQVGAKAFEQAVKQVVPCVSDDDTRPILTGVLLRVQKGKLVLVATDTHRLAVSTVAVEGETECEAIVPGRALEELLRLIDVGDTLTVVIHENQVEFRGHDFLLQTRRIEGQFPKYERILPSSYLRAWIMNRSELAAALRRLRIVARDATAKDRVQCVAESGSLTMLAQGEQGTASEELEAEVPEEHFAAAFNVNYLIEAANVCGTERVRLEISEALSPAVMRPVDGNDFLEVIMPMQVQ